MWIFWLLAVLLLLVVVGGVFAGGIFTIIGVPLGLVLAGVLVLTYIRRGDEAPQVVERREPTGVPRKASNDAETANERVGQEG
jgi:hypothetical protein